MVEVFVDDDKFLIHKTLISNAFAGLTEVLEDRRQTYVSFPKENPGSFKLLINYLYTKKLPGIVEGSPPKAQAQRLRELIQLYTLGEKHKLRPQILNLVIDRVQDGFWENAKIPQPDLIANVYKHSEVGSKLRKFVVACVLYWLRHNDCE